MKFVASCFVLGVLCSWHQASASQSSVEQEEPLTPAPSLNPGCQNKTALQREQAKCFSALGLVLEGWVLDVGDFQSIIQKDPALACRAPKLYQAALKCVQGLAHKCLTDGGKLLLVLPTAHNLDFAIDYLCKHLEDSSACGRVAIIADADPECVASQKESVEKCTKANDVVAGQEESAFQGLRRECHASIWNAECQNEVLLTCGCEVKCLYTFIAAKYLNPSGCSPVSFPRDKCTDSGPACAWSRSDSNTNLNLQAKSSTSGACAEIVSLMAAVALGFVMRYFP